MTTEEENIPNKAPIERTLMTDMVVDKLLKFILDNNLTEGDRLPPSGTVIVIH